MSSSAAGYRTFRSYQGPDPLGHQLRALVLRLRVDAEGVVVWDQRLVQHVLRRGWGRALRQGFRVITRIGHRDQTLALAMRRLSPARIFHILGRMPHPRWKEIRRVGALIDRFKAKPLERRRRLFQMHGISLVLDVGANTGQYARELRRAGYRGRIISFEPVRSAFARLRQAAARDGRWTAERLALGRRDGTATINVSGDSRASSMLAMLPAHREVAGYFDIVGDEEVEVRRLDSVFDRYVRPSDRVLLKLDVQGLEPQVLEGARASLARVAGIQIELSLAPLYRGELGIVPMLSRLQRAGFALMSLEYGFCNPKTGQMLQVDGLLFRPLTDGARAPTGRAPARSGARAPRPPGR